ncbi:MAG: TfoX family protein [Chloroflexota bacterium]|nr:MAG: TfoX family protein [Chloroflexota bacterium]
MAYDETLATRIRDVLALDGDVSEMKMFGGIAYLVGGNMGVGIVGEKLMVRVGGDDHDRAMADPHAEPMDFNGRPMRGMIYVRPHGIADDEALRRWVDWGIGYARAQPVKKKK